MSNAKQMSLNEERIYDENQGRKKCKKSFMERAIWVDFPLNAVIIAYVAFWIARAFEIGPEEALVQAIPLVGKSDLMDELLIYCLPMMVVCIVLAVAVEFIYLILKLCRKEPFITEKYAIIIMIAKVIWVVTFIAAALFFLYI